MNENKELQHIKSNREFKEMLRNKDEFEDSIKRIKNGVFYTPAPLVNLAHQYIEKEFGKNWKSEYSVYDPAWGTGNLTRDYIFDDLYCSTLEGEDLKLAKNLNKGSRKFQMDFLNDDNETSPKFSDFLTKKLGSSFKNKGTDLLGKERK